jgi:5-methylcytosine-specific restriction protein A
MTSLRGHERKEFPQSVRKKAFQRCCLNGTIPGVPQCEKCGIELKSGNIEYEHIDADGLGGEPTLENCGVWCRSSCSRKKTSEEDIPRMAKADAVLKKSFGLEPTARQKIASRGFSKAPPQRRASSEINKWRGF